MRHPLHYEHPLTLLPPPLLSPPSRSTANVTTALCNECRSPCLGFAYQCKTCQFILHLKCFSTIKHRKHEHTLSLMELGYTGSYFYCSVCGFRGDGLCFACTSCKFFIHHERSLVPPTVKHHHVHELTFEYNYPDESDLAYCDVCEDKDGKELDRSLSYYYCKRCDYIAHVHCVTQPKELETVQLRHNHPLVFSRKHMNRFGSCDACGIKAGGSYYSCTQCTYVIHKSCAEFPSLIKHPLHQEHALILDKNSGSLLCCTDCEFTLEVGCAVVFKHPHHNDPLWFSNDDGMFQCDACGKLGKRFRMQCQYNNCACNFDLHLECFALPGEITYESHPHNPLILFSSLTKYITQDVSKSQCGICHKETDPELWTYHCKECNYASDLNCVAKSGIKEVNEEKNSIATIWQAPSFGYASTSLDEHLACPICKLPIPMRAYSCINDWKSSHGNNYEENSIITVYGRTPAHSDAVTLLDEQLIEELFCSICSLLIFPPTYSCASCKIFFHKSCAELPRKYVSDGGHTFALLAPPFCNGSSKCSNCEYTIGGYAYICLVCEIILDVQCALGAPLMKHMNDEHQVFCWRPEGDDVKCKACGTGIDDGTLRFICSDFCEFNLHVECALLPPIVKHKIHQHPLGLVPDLADLDNEYICDVCEKDLNPFLWAYRCLDTCQGYATSHVTCLITSKKKCLFRHDDELRGMTEDQMVEFRRRVRAHGKGN